MPESNPPVGSANADTLWAVCGQHVDEYNRIVKPDWVFSISHYFRRRWVPHLGAGPAWLVVSLRQWCYRDERDWCIVSREQLGRDIGVHEDTISDFAARGFASWFIESQQGHRYDQRAGRPKQDFNRYVLLMDEPLAPEDFLAVEKLLAEAAAAAADPIAAVRELLQDLLAMPGQGLADRLADVADRALPSAKRQRAERIEALIARPERTVADLVETTVGPLPAASRAEIRELCSELQRQIVAPEEQYVGTHYFRLKWVPLLGHLLAWKVVALRSRCYWNAETGELRDECPVWPKALAAELGCSARWINSLPKRPYAGGFLQVLEHGRKKPTKYRVQMPEPLTPDDQTAFQVQLSRKRPARIDPYTGQMAMEFETREPDNGILTALGEKENGTPAPDNGTLTAHIRILIEYLDTNRILSEHQQHADAFSVSDEGDAVRSLLDLLEIYGRNRARILDSGLAPDAILAWVLSGLAQPDMENLAGYVFSQVTSADPAPPPRFLEFARLGPKAWDLFVTVALGDDQAIPPNLQEAFERWDELFGCQLREEARQARWQMEVTGHLQVLDPDGAGGTVWLLTDVTVSTEQALWQAVLRELQLQMPKATFDTRVRDTRLLSCHDDVFVIGAQNPFDRDWLENRLLATVERTLVGIVGHPVEVQFVLMEPAGQT